VVVVVVKVHPGGGSLSFVSALERPLLEHVEALRLSSFEEDGLDAEGRLIVFSFALDVPLSFDWLLALKSPILLFCYVRILDSFSKYSSSNNMNMKHEKCRIIT